jgi:hypothetical protein
MGEEDNGAKIYVTNEDTPRWIVNGNYAGFPKSVYTGNN